MPPRYSVLLPTHNRADVIGYAISSVLQQTDDDFELLVVGDGCTDGTSEIVGSFRDPRIRWFDLPKAPDFGYANRNIALREARGELVAFAAHDDLLLPDHLALVGAPFVEASVELAYSRPMWVADDGRMVPFAVDLRVAEQLNTFLTHHNSIPASCVVYRRECHDRIGFWPEDGAVGGDWTLWQRIIGPSRGANMAYVADSTVLHFRADWRTGATWGPDPLPAWLDLAATEAWPLSLRVEIEPGRSPQEVFWGLISKDGSSWAGSVRAAARAALDYVAWTSASRLAEGAVKVADLGRRLAHAERVADQLGRDYSRAQADFARARTEAAAADARAADGEARAARADSLLAKQGVAGQVRRMARRLRLALRGNPLFDPRWYTDRYGDVELRQARQHWLKIGAAELRDPNSWFSTRAYVERYADIRSSSVNPLDHYYLHGAAEGRSPASNGSTPT